MAQFVSSNVLDSGINYIVNNSERMVVLSAYTFGDSYAVVTGNILAAVAVTSGNFTVSSSGNNRQVQNSAGLQDASADATGTSSHFAFLNDTGTEVVWVTDETSLQTITAGNPVNFPQLTYTSNQPTAV